jgi:diacylglycerol kinase
MIKKIVTKFSHPIRGIVYAIANDRAFQLQFFGGIFVLGIFITGYTYFFTPLSQVEILFLGLAYTLILITELQNTSFEEALDRLHPELHDSIKRSKDMAAGSVLISGLFLLFVMATIVLF